MKKILLFLLLLFCQPVFADEFFNPSSGISQTVGTWTPVLTTTSPGNLSVVYAEQIGSWIKTGRLVTVFYNIQTTTFTWTTATGSVIITGLPFAASFPDSSSASMGNVAFQGIAAAGYTNFTTEIDQGNSNLAISASGPSTTNITLQIANFPSDGTNKSLIGTVTYTAAN